MHTLNTAIPVFNHCPGKPHTTPLLHEYKDIPLSLQALRSGDYKFSERGTMDAAVEARPCEKEFKTRCRSPLSDMNRVVHDVSVVAATIVKTTKGS
ncbi:hypothetical protein POTOM_060268 [Populus tomentosa]|uniref:Uncharacterized protein n=1 Tax=Populus tomentosa TaxID=118781 RepID=A0A8X8C0J1_POPTO|nr:hypothetical protein POTOM_060268 [Populus tomentosa]